MSEKLGGEKHSVQNALINYVSREPSLEYITSDGKKIFLNLGWEYLTPEKALRLRGGESGRYSKARCRSLILALWTIC